MKLSGFAVAGIAALLTAPAVADAGGLRGSPASMREQHKIAVERDLTFMSNGDDVRELVKDGGLVELESNADYRLNSVSFPYAVPEVKLFIERLARQYNAANGGQLVVTSLSRPASAQPGNAHDLSVHPAGMAADLRVPPNAKARRWLESVLLQLENAGVLDVTRERNPPHYHVAVFPAPYAAYVDRMVPALDATRDAATRVEVADAELSFVQTAVVAESTDARRPNAMAIAVAIMLATGIAFSMLLSGNRRARAKST